MLLVAGCAGTGSPTDGPTSASSGSEPPPAPVAVRRAKGEHLLVSSKTASSTAARALLANVDARLNEPGSDRSSTENVALAYLLSGEKRYARAAYAWAEHAMTANLRADSYLRFGDLMRQVSLVLDWCGEALSAKERDTLAGYLDRSLNELWFENQGSGWGLADPGNNYHAAFLEGTAFAARALAAQKHANAAKYEGLLRDKIEKKGGLLEYLEQRAVGGDWSEGANYGQRTKQRLGMAFAALATTGGPNYFERTRFFDDAIVFAVYQLQPDRRSLYPAGDLSRDTAMLVSPYDRDYVQVFARFSKSDKARGLARWYLDHAAPSYEQGSFRWPAALYKDALFPLDAKKIEPSTLPRSYVARGTGFVNLRSAWDAQATSLTLSAPSILDQSHSHLDASSFTLFKGGWQALDAASLGRSGLNWEMGAHNMVHVPGCERRGGTLGGLTHFVDASSYAYAQIDATGVCRRKADGELLSELTRELVYLRPDTVVVYDRVAAKDTSYTLRVHFGSAPARRGQLYTASHAEGALALQILQGGAANIRPDTDLSERGSAATRLEIEPRDPQRGRFLTVLQVGLTPPKLDARAIDGDGIAGALVGDTVVVLSANDRGSPAKLPFRYRIPGTDKRTHLLVNVTGKLDAKATREAGATVIHVSRGGTHAADAHGVVRMSL